MPPDCGFKPLMVQLLLNFVSRSKGINVCKSSKCCIEKLGSLSFQLHYQKYSALSNKVAIKTCCSDQAFSGLFCLQITE